MEKRTYLTLIEEEDICCSGAIVFLEDKQDYLII